MPEEPKRPKNLIGVAVFIIVVLIAVGGAIYYFITQSLRFTPNIEDVAAVPCRCKWISEDDQTHVFAEASGYVSGSSCIFPEAYEIAGIDIEDCSDITELEEVERLVATQESGALGPGVIAMSSDPVQPPTVLSEDNQKVTFTVDFALYSLDEPLEYNQAEMKYIYPITDESPDPLLTELTEDNTSQYTYIENGQTVTGYRVTFLSTWNEVLNYGEEGLYKVSFRAKDSNDVWTDEATGTLQYTVGEVATGAYYCNDLDIVQTRTTEAANVTIQAIATLPEGYESTYTWELDLDCNQDIGEDEVFTTTTDTITKEFTYPANGTGEVECPASVEIKLNDGTEIENRSEESCSGVITLTALPEFCGDGNLDEGEECDPEIPEGEEGYNENCLDNCTIPEEEEEEPEPGEDEEEPEPGEDITTNISVSQVCPSCIEISGAEPIVDLSITVTNSGDTSQTVRAVSNSLPQGLTFSTGSSLVNDVENTSDDGVTVETSGESQLITWDNNENGWTITGNGGTLTVKFTANVGEDVEEGTYNNTVTVTPADADPIQSETGVVLAADCQQPETALFDRTIYPIIIGTSFLLLATLAYYTGIGTHRFSKLMDNLSEMSLVVTKPQKFMERKIENKALKQIRSSNKKGKK